MISLQVENYCQNCRDFKPYCNTLIVDRKPYTIVECTRKDRCRCNEIYKQARDDIRKEIRNERGC